MPSAITLPVFNDEEILLYETMNSLVEAIQARFTAGIGTADLSWPLTAEGNLDMSVFEITGGRKIWGIVNVENYPAATQLADAIAAAGANGVVLVPPETTVAAASTGHALGTWTGAIIGAGASSVIQMDAAASANMLTATGGNGMLANLTLDGGTGSTGFAGLVISGGVDTVVQNVWSKRFTGTAGVGLKIASGATSVKIDGFFSTASTDGIACTGCEQLSISNVRVEGYTGVGFNFVVAAATTRVVADNVHMKTVGGAEGIIFTGSGGVGVGNGEFHGTNIHIKGATGVKDGMVLGTTSAALERVMLSNCTVEDATKIGLTVTANRGVINGVDIDNPSTTGIDMDTSTNLRVSNCNIASGADGIDMADVGVGCIAENNSFASMSGTHVLHGDNSEQVGNAGVLTDGHEQAMFNLDNTLVAASGGAQTVCSITIPANTLKVGSMIVFEAFGTVTGNAISHTMAVRLNDVALATEGSGSSTNGNSEMRMSGSAVILTTATAASQWLFVSSKTAGADDYRSIPNYDGAISGLDTTVAQDISIRLTPGGTTTDGVWVRSLYVRIVRGKLY